MDKFFFGGGGRRGVALTHRAIYPKGRGVIFAHGPIYQRGKRGLH